MVKKTEICSPYTRAYNAICEGFESDGYIPLNEGRVLEVIECIPGLRFKQGTTLNKVLQKLERWGNIVWIKPRGLTEKVVIPLDV